MCLQRSLYSTIPKPKEDNVSVSFIIISFDSGFMGFEIGQIKILIFP